MVVRKRIPLARREIRERIIWGERGLYLVVLWKPGPPHREAEPGSLGEIRTLEKDERSVRVLLRLTPASSCVDECIARREEKRPQCLLPHGKEGLIIGAENGEFMRDYMIYFLTGQLECPRVWNKNNLVRCLEILSENWSKSAASAWVFPSVDIVWLFGNPFQVYLVSIFKV